MIDGAMPARAKRWSNVNQSLRARPRVRHVWLASSVSPGGDRLGHCCQLSVDATPSERRIEPFWDQQEIHVLGQPLNQPPRFGQARSSLEDHLTRRVALGHHPQHLGDVVVLLDKRLLQTRRRRRCNDRCLEVAVLA